MRVDGLIPHRAAERKWLMNLVMGVQGAMRLRGAMGERDLSGYCLERHQFRLCKQRTGRQRG